MREANIDDQNKVPLDKFCKFNLDWFGKPALRKCEFKLSIDKFWLTFAANWYQAPLYSASGTVGTFREGLWEEELVELFIRHSDSKHYLEFNLNPYGEWWGAFFMGYRSRDSVLADWKGKVGLFASQADQVWSSKIEIPLSLLKDVFPIDEKTIFNVCSIMGDEEKQFFSWQKPLAGEPDFHRVIA